MSPSELLPWLSGGGGAIFALLLGWGLMLSGHLLTGRAHREIVKAKEQMIRDKQQQIDTLVMALARERERGDAGILAAQVTREVMTGVRKAIE